MQPVPDVVRYAAQRQSIWPPDDDVVTLWRVVAWAPGNRCYPIADAATRADAENHAAQLNLHLAA